MSDIMPDDIDRGHAMLTKGHRKFLKSDGSGYSRQVQKEHRDAIRQRVKDTLLDFSLLFEHWPEEECDEVFDDLMDENGSIDDLVDVFASLYSATEVTGAFTEALERGVRKAEYRQSPLEVPQLAIQPKFEVERFPKAGLSAVEKYQKGPEGIAELTDAEARLLLDALYIDDTLDEDSVVQAELRFQKFLDGEPPDELETKDERYEQMKEDRKNRSEYYKEQNRESNDPPESGLDW